MPRIIAPKVEQIDNDPTIVGEPVKFRVYGVLKVFWSEWLAMGRGGRWRFIINYWDDDGFANDDDLLCSFHETLVMDRFNPEMDTEFPFSFVHVVPDAYLRREGVGDDTVEVYCGLHVFADHPPGHAFKTKKDTKPAIGVSLKG